MYIQYLLDSQDTRNKDTTHKIFIGLHTTDVFKHKWHTVKSFHPLILHIKMNADIT